MTILVVIIFLTCCQRRSKKRKTHYSFVGSCPVSTVLRHVRFTQKEQFNNHKGLHVSFASLRDVGGRVVAGVDGQQLFSGRRLASWRSYPGPPPPEMGLMVSRCRHGQLHKDCKIVAARVTQAHSCRQEKFKRSNTFFQRFVVCFDFGCFSEVLQATFQQRRYATITKQHAQPQTRPA